jgi:hypothetical protein
MAAAASFLASLQIYIVPVKYSSKDLLSHEGTIIVHGGLIASSPYAQSITPRGCSPALTG